MILTFIATAYRALQEVGFFPKDVVLFPFLVLGAWLLFLYWVFAGPRAVRRYNKAYKAWAREKRSVAYTIAILIGAVIGGASGAGWWGLYERHRKQLAKLHEKAPEAMERIQPHEAMGKSADPSKKSSANGGPEHPVAHKSRGTRYSRLSEEELSQEALELAAKIRRLKQEYLSESLTLSNTQMARRDMNDSDEKKKRMFFEDNQEYVQLSQRYMQEFEIKYRTNALMMREALLDRLPGVLHNRNADGSYAATTSLVQLQVVVDDLERLAKELRPKS